MTAADLAGTLLRALAATALATVVAVPLAVALARLAAPWAASLAALVLVLILLPLPDPATLPHAATLLARAAPLLPFLALPLGWGLRRVPAGDLRIAASLAPPAAVLRHVWLPVALPWLLAGLGLALARALAGTWLAAPAALLLAAAAWPVLRALAARPT